MKLSYARYLDQVLGGWIGKSIGGTVGARFEGYKGWIELATDAMFPDRIPPNDDLDLQVLWLKVLEKRGATLTSHDLAEAWLEGCWYPFNEYGIFRRNYRLGIHPPWSGRFTNQFWETGMGCPIRSEIWGYVFPGAPDLAAQYARRDGILDHTAESVGGERMFAAMASMAFFVPDVRRLASMFIHYLPEGTPIERLTRVAFEAFDAGASLRDARDRVLAIAGNPEACDARTNVPFTFLGLLYGGNDLEKTLRSALACGYDTDCTLATAAAFIGQILGASGIPKVLKSPIGDELVMGIEYHREEMTLSALARDTARMGVLLSQNLQTGVVLHDAPTLAPLPAAAQAPRIHLTVDYGGLPAAAPGEAVQAIIGIEGPLSEQTPLVIESPPGWTAVPDRTVVGRRRRMVSVTLHAPEQPVTWPQRNLFTARLETAPPTEVTFGVGGAGLWQFLGVYYDPLPEEDNPKQQQRSFNHHFVALDRSYLPEPDVDVDKAFTAWSLKLGRPAVVASYEHEVDPTRLIGLTGAYCCYLTRTVIAPDAREAHIVVGNNDGFRLYLNGEKVGEENEVTMWSPFNNVYRVQLEAGENTLLLKLLKRRDGLRFTLGFRAATGTWGTHHNSEDWLVDLADSVP